MASTDTITQEDGLEHCGYVAIIGRPNVGKSTLLNHVLGQKISITTEKPQTTRHRILGIKSTSTSQVIYVDTPGLHRGIKRAINRYMNRTALSVMSDVDVILFVVDGMHWTEEDQYILDKLKLVDTPVVLVINKVDRIRYKKKLLPYLEEISRKVPFAAIIPVSALKGDNITRLEEEVTRLLPRGDAFFPLDQVTDRNERFLASELVREKLMKHLAGELPYAVTVETSDFKQNKKLIHIETVIWVERDAQKAIVIGRQGEMLKRIGSEARRDMERIFAHKVFLQLWVKVRKKWADDEKALRSFGYTE